MVLSPRSRRASWRSSTWPRGTRLPDDHRIPSGRSSRRSPPAARPIKCSGSARDLSQDGEGAQRRASAEARRAPPSPDPDRVPAPDRRGSPGWSDPAFHSARSLVPSGGARPACGRARPSPTGGEPAVATRLIRQQLFAWQHQRQSARDDRAGAGSSNGAVWLGPLDDSTARIETLVAPAGYGDNLITPAEQWLGRKVVAALVLSGSTPLSSECGPHWRLVSHAQRPRSFRTATHGSASTSARFPLRPKVRDHSRGSARRGPRRGGRRRRGSSRRLPRAPGRGGCGSGFVEGLVVVSSVQMPITSRSVGRRGSPRAG